MAHRGLRSTSTGAESTRAGAAAGAHAEEHLCEGGEQAALDVLAGHRLRPPPRARRARPGDERVGAADGTISASAKSTCTGPASVAPTGDHLRERGVHQTSEDAMRGQRGPPPRARRARRRGRAGPGRAGTTSASAESTCASPGSRWPGSDHLREREEHANNLIYNRIRQGPPSRARRAQDLRGPVGAAAGTTSASAESTSCSGTPGTAARDHLRERGEHQADAWVAGWGGGPPPRARRARCTYPHRRRHHGTTSASAESTPPRPAPAADPRDHLRERG